MKHSFNSIWVVINATFLVTTTSAQEVEDKTSVCRLDDTTSLLRKESKEIPNYFFRPFPNSDKVSYASGGKNFILDLMTGNEQEIPGPYDPVPTPDEQLMTIPPDEGLTFYDLDQMSKGTIKPLFIDDKLKGVYQSVGISQHTKDSTTYRFITDQDGLSFRDYEVKNEGGNQKVTPKGEKATILCKGMRLSLPMLSKDGTELAALDVDAGVTKIFEINPTDGSCKPVLNLGIPTGKVDFNFNNDDITFHVLNNNLKGSEYFKVPSDSMVMNVFVFKRSTGEISRITNNTDSNSVYPAFRRDGKIVYMHHPKRHGTEKKPSTFVVADPSLSNRVPFEVIQNATCKGVPAPEAFNSLTALGGLWGQVCSVYGNEMTAPVAALTTLSLDPKRCKELVSKYWKTFRDKVIEMPGFKNSPKIQGELLRQLTEEDLLAACPTQSFQSHGTQNGNAQPTPDLGTHSAIPESCFECHDGAIPFESLERLRTERAKSGKTWVEEIRDRIQRTGRGKMPPDRPLNEEERKRLLVFIGSN